LAKFVAYYLTKFSTDKENATNVAENGSGSTEWPKQHSNWKIDCENEVID